jgi:hypothetical protein
VVPTDRQLVDCLLATILSTSQFIELILGEEIERILLEPVVDPARLKALGDARREFHLRALIMEYVLKAPL